MTSVADVLKQKGSTVFTIHQEDTIRTAMDLLAKQGVGALVVTDHEGELTGIFTERDFARFCAGKDSISLTSPISEVMTPKVICVDPTYSVEHCLGIMTDMRMRHLPVLTNQKLSGLISIGDAVKAVLTEQEHLIDQLEHYIAGSL